MMLPAYLALVVALFWVCLVASRASITFLNRRGLIAISGARSSHKGAVPQGAGIAFVPPLAAAILLMALINDSGSFWLIVVVATAVLAAVSFVDDIREVSVSLRLSVHFATAIALASLIDGPYVPTFFLLSETTGRAVLVICMVAWINLYNFMDGIDGITVVQTVTIALSAAALLIGVAGHGLSLTVMVAGFIGTAALAFAFVNWHPARAFMGDIGAVALAVLTGGLYLAAQRDVSIILLAIPALFYLLDGISTLVMRIVRREPFWRAHRSHAYQVYVARGHGHDRACAILIALNVVLLAIALIPADVSHWTRLALAVTCTCGVLIYFRTARALQSG
ncbi:MAG: hypothetical protein AAFZ01_08430 [Pseudomonadota bacterium]